MANYRRQMTPGMKKCMDMYGGKKTSPNKYSLEHGAGQSVDKIENKNTDAAHMLNLASTEFKKAGM